MTQPLAGHENIFWCVIEWDLKLDKWKLTVIGLFIVPIVDGYWIMDPTYEIL